MPDLRIERDHDLGLPVARQLASRWIAAAERDYGLTCLREEGEVADRITFSRSGVSGELRVTGGRFELDAKLGFLLSAFKDKITAEVSRNLDQLLASGDATA